MSIPHLQPGEVFSVLPLQERLAESRTQTLVKTNALEVLRLVLPAGKVIPEHRAPSEITVQCLEGRTEFTTQSGAVSLGPGDMLYLSRRASHSLRAVENSSLLVTLLLEETAQRSD
jgi:quercetin dioxygenase-like cupin family protein